ncbi:MAG: VWA domain-containing protein [Candidatus Rokubacteria bacterium]|nr:VWA domain-containing protein [Candidatus Rokubacteria bacterium]
MLFRYSRWDGSQDVPDLDADDLLDRLSDDVLSHGDPWSAIQRMLQQGMRRPDGERVRGLRDLLERLRQKRQHELSRWDLDTSMEDIAKKLEDVIQTERQGVQQMPAGRERTRHERQLDALPPNPAGQMRALQRYDFVSPEARQKFDELLKSLQAQLLKPFMQGVQQSLQNMTKEDLARIREMIQDLNRMLRDRAEGREPDFEKFKQKWGGHFPGVNSLDELLERLAQQAAAMQSLMRSLSPEQRGQLGEMMRSLFMRDERLEAAMSQLAGNLSQLLPMEDLGRRYPFQGDEQTTLPEAMELMDRLQQMDRMEADLRGTRNLEDLDRLSPADMERLVGKDAAEDLERLQEISKRLEDAGYLEREGDELTLTAKAIRKIADKALGDIFQRLKRDRFGGHVMERRGSGGDQTDDTKAYEFGDPFLLDLKGTVMNAVERNGAGTPVRLAPEDFEVHRTERRTQCATVVMLDMSRSMLNNGYFLPGKKVALALSALIRGQFPRDALYIVGFSLYAREFKPAELPTLSWSEWNMGTNMHAGFMLSRQLLARHVGGTKQILMVTDGEPTAHMEDGEADFSYPPTRRTIEETLKEAKRCTKDGITINTFMLERSPWLTRFVEEMARINRGRAFFTTPDRLGEYVVVDFVSSRRRPIS